MHVLLYNEYKAGHTQLNEELIKVYPHMHCKSYASVEFEILNSGFIVKLVLHYEQILGDKHWTQLATLQFIMH